MPDFTRLYRRVYENLGRPLQRKDATPATEIRAAEKRLGIRVPRALAEYYRLAGRAADFNSAYDRLLPPSEWTIENKNLVFLAENQAVVVYGTAASADPADDPPAFMCANEEPFQWSRMNAKCSVFLLTMLHWEASFGGALPTGGTAKVKPSLKKTLDQSWSFIGEVNGMRAYRKPGRVVCFLKWEPEWRVYVGAVDDRRLKLIERELKLVWDQC